MIKDFVKIFLFLSSYTPLFLIVAIKNFNNIYIAGMACLLIIISLGVLFFIINRADSMNGEFHIIAEVEEKSDQFIEYILAYIIPFFGLNFTSLEDAASLGVLFILIAVLYIRSDLIFMNPILNLLGYNLYKVNDGKSGLMIITKEEVKKGAKLKIYMISKKVGVAKINVAK